MNVTRTDIHATTPAQLLAAGAPADAAFAQLLHTADPATDRTPRSTDAQTREAAESLVASTFIGPLLAQVRQDPFRSDLFHGGLAEDIFAAQLDSTLAQRITHATAMPLVDAVYNRVLAHGGKVNTHG